MIRSFAALSIGLAGKVFPILGDEGGLFKDNLTSGFCVGFGRK